MLFLAIFRGNDSFHCSRSGNTLQVFTKEEKGLFPQKNRNKKQRNRRNNQKRLLHLIPDTGNLPTGGGAGATEAVPLAPLAAASAARTSLATGVAAPGDDGAALPFAGDEHAARSRRRAKRGEHRTGNGCGCGLMLLRTPPPPSRSSPLRLTSQPNEVRSLFTGGFARGDPTPAAGTRDFVAFLQLGMQQGHERGPRERETERDRASSSSLILTFFFSPAPDAVLRALWYGDAVCAEQLSCSLLGVLFGAHGEMGSRTGGEGDTGSAGPAWQ